MDCSQSIEGDPAFGCSDPQPTDQSMTGLTPEPGRVQVEAAFLLWFQLFTEIDDIFSHSCKIIFKLNFDLLQATKNCLFFNSHKHLCSIDIFRLPCLLPN